MSAATSPPTNVVEYIRSLSPADKNAALVELLSEATRAHGDSSPIPFRNTKGESLGYYVPPPPSKERLQEMLARMTPEERERGQRALADLSKTFDVDEFLQELNCEDRD